jgi:hypothetical protein
MSTKLLSEKERFISSDWKLKCLGFHSRCVMASTVWTWDFMISSSIPFPKPPNSKRVYYSPFSRNISSTREDNVQRTTAQGGQKYQVF